MTSAKEDTEMEIDEGENKKAEDLTNADVVTKYRKAGEIANAALNQVMAATKAGVKVLDLCILGDAYITAETKKIYNNKKMEKGIGFPTCVSVNNIVGHFSPLSGDNSTIKDGDLVKVDLGVQIDGYVAVVAHTFAVPAGTALKGKQADAIAAAHTAAEAAIRLLKPGHKNTEITDMFAKIAADFKVNAVQGVLSHSMSRFTIDGENVIVNRADPEQKAAEFEFKTNEVYAIDIVMSSGDGKPKDSEDRTTVFKRTPETTYHLKMQTSRAVFGEIQKKFPTFPFTIRDLSEEKKAKFAVVECLQHQLLNDYPVLVEKEGDAVAHIKFTALLLPAGTVQITGLPVDRSKLNTEHKVSKEVHALLMTSKGGAGGGKKKKGKKSGGGAKKAAGGESKSAGAADEDGDAEMDAGDS